MELTLDLNKIQIDFLKEFARNNYPGSKDNDNIDRPMYLVQTVNHEYEKGPDKGNRNVYINIESEIFDVIYTPDAVVNLYGNEHIPVISYILACKNGINGKAINSVTDYFEYYNVPKYIVTYSEKDIYKTVAYFFIKNEAYNYTRFQAKNLENPRILAVHRGQGNDGCYEYEHFYDLLLTIGTQLNATLSKDDEYKNKMLLSLVKKCEDYINSTTNDKSGLWENNIDAHIKKMKELYKTSTTKPQWVTLQKIDKYADIMNARISVIELAENIEKYFYDRGEYTDCSSKSIKWLRDRKGNRFSRTGVKNAVYDSITKDIDPLIDYFTNEISLLLDKESEMMTIAKTLKKQLQFYKDREEKI